MLGLFLSLPLCPTTVSAKVKVNPRIWQGTEYINELQAGLSGADAHWLAACEGFSLCSCCVSQNLEYNPHGPCTLSRSEPQEEVPLPAHGETPNSQ